MSKISCPNCGSKLELRNALPGLKCPTCQRVEADPRSRGDRAFFKAQGRAKKTRDAAFHVARDTYGKAMAAELDAYAVVKKAAYEAYRSHIEPAQKARRAAEVSALQARDAAVKAAMSKWHKDKEDERKDAIVGFDYPPEQQATPKRKRRA